MQTSDINGHKQNRFGQKMEVDQRLVGMTAGVSGAVNQDYQKSSASHQISQIFNMGYADLPPKPTRVAKKADDFTKPTNKSE